MLFGHAHTAMTAADVVLVASGTASLEAALLKRPMVVAYRLAPLSWHIMKRMSYLPYVGLPNILSGRFVVPEFLQEAVVPTALADALERWLLDKDAVAEALDVFTEIHHSLRQNTAERAAEALLPLLQKGAA